MRFSFGCHNVQAAHVMSMDRNLTTWDHVYLEGGGMAGHGLDTGISIGRSACRIG
jgi:hypothetical protein